MSTLPNCLVLKNSLLSNPATVINMSELAPLWGASSVFYWYDGGFTTLAGDRHVEFSIIAGYASMLPTAIPGFAISSRVVSRLWSGVEVSRMLRVR